MSLRLPTLILAPNPPLSGGGQKKASDRGGEARETEAHQRHRAAVEELAAGDGERLGIRRDELGHGRRLRADGDDFGAAALEHRVALVRRGRSGLAVAGERRVGLVLTARLAAQAE